MSEVTETLERHGVEIRSLSAEIEDGRSQYTIQIRISPSGGLQEVLEEISTLPGVERLSVTGLREVE
jgi:(p)ppGpp synthase/HD superfamily hydrolase